MNLSSKSTKDLSSEIIQYQVHFEFLLRVALWIVSELQVSELCDFITLHTNS